MRLWSVHPRFLDRPGLLAMWREGLLARAVLSGRTRGYTRHPQLDRFRSCADPVAELDCLLSRVADEAAGRGYHFDTSRISYRGCPRGHIRVTDGQIAFEWAHLLAKLAIRDPVRHAAVMSERPEPATCFLVVPGPVADWERG